MSDTEPLAALANAYELRRRSEIEVFLAENQHQLAMLSDIYAEIAPIFVPSIRQALEVFTYVEKRAHWEPFVYIPAMLEPKEARALYREFDDVW